MLELSAIDLDELAMALEDQTDYDHRWLLDPRTGQLTVWTSDTGIDGQSPVELDELDLVAIDPIPSYIWYQDMVDFAESISNQAAGRRLGRSLEGRGPFRRFKDQLYRSDPELLTAWHSFHTHRAQRRAVDWLLDEGLISEAAADQFQAEHPSPQLS